MKYINDLGFDVEQIQEVLFELLAKFDKICRDNNLKYYLDGGTFLGAVRHGGFIPWDDDIDVVMERSDYKKIIKYFKTNTDKTIAFDCIELDKFYEYNFGKIKTTEVFATETGMENTKSIKGLWIDVFPLDKATMKTYKKQARFSQMWQMVRWTKLGIPCKSHHQKIVNFLTKTNTLGMINRNANFWMEKYFHSKMNTVSKICHPGKNKDPHPVEFYRDFAEYDFTFKGKTIKCYGPRDFDGWLTMRYGDWKKLPPLEEQKPTHCLSKLSFEKQ